MPCLLPLSITAKPIKQDIRLDTNLRKCSTGPCSGDLIAAEGPVVSQLKREASPSSSSYALEESGNLQRMSE